MRHFTADTMTELYDNLCEALIYGQPDTLDVITSVDVQVHDVVAEAESMVWDFDLKDAWLTKARWSMMVRQYIDPYELEAWIQRCTSRIGTKGRGIAFLRTKVVQPRGGEATGHTNKETRRWGSCMIALSYKALPKPQITLYSRTSYLGYIGALDVTVAWMISKYLAKEMGVPLESFKFVWYNQAIQWHNFKSLAYMLNNHDEDKREQYRRYLMSPSSELTRDEKRTILGNPAIKLSRKWLQKVMQDDRDGRKYGDMTYNTFRRIVRRFHTEVYGYDRAQDFESWALFRNGPKKGQQKEYFKAYGSLPSIKVDTLDFKAIGMPSDRRYGDPFIGGEEDDDVDED